MVEPQSERSRVNAATRIVAGVFLEGSRAELIPNNKKDGDVVVYKIPGLPWIFDNRQAVRQSLRIIYRHEGDESFDQNAAMERFYKDRVSQPAYVTVVKEVSVDNRVRFHVSLYDLNEGIVPEERNSFSVTFIDEPEVNLEYGPSEEYWLNLRTQPNGLLAIAVTGVDHPLGISGKNKKWLLTDKVEVTDVPATQAEIEMLSKTLRSSDISLAKPSPATGETETDSPEKGIGPCEPNVASVTIFGEVDSSIGAALAANGIATDALAAACIDSAASN